MADHRRMRALMLTCGATLALAGWSFVSPAQAGFEWTPPPKAAPRAAAPKAAPADPVMPAAPAADVQEAPLTPEPGAVEADSAAADEAHMEALEAADALTAPPAHDAPAEQDSAPMALTSEPAAAVEPAAEAEAQPEVMQEPVEAPAMAGGFETVEGFGRDVPLALALRQVVPARYAFSFAPDVDAGTRVSWEGGKPWNEVVTSMVEAHRLTVTVKGNAVYVRRAGSVEAPVEAPASDDQSALTPAPEAAETETDTETAMAPAPAEDASASAPLEASSSDESTGAPEPLVIPPAEEEASAEEQEASAADDAAPTQDVAAATWEAKTGASLRRTLESWSKTAGAELRWTVPYDYFLESDVSVNGRYQDAVAALLDKFTAAKPRPLGRLHPNLPEGPAVLVIDSAPLPTLPPTQ